jgi:glycosyltransferase involved in cell wall biosynthesis
VPCFRQRDVAAATRFARHHGVKLLFDPLISAWDKQVFERGKFAPGGAASRKLLARERALFRAADLVLADTGEHLRFFAEHFGLEPEKLAVVPVGAEEPLFHPSPTRHAGDASPEALFFGSFIGLQGPGQIVEAARLYKGPPLRWTLLGEGPLLADCRRRAEGLDNVSFESWIPYADLPARIHRADIVLGIFGGGAKAGRVIPNKVYQALACGRPVITRESGAYPEALRTEAEPGIVFAPPEDPEALAEAVSAWAARPERLAALGAAAADSYERYFSNRAVGEALAKALAEIKGHNT